MRIIPKQTRVKMEFFKNIGLTDAIIGLIGIAILVFLFTSNLPWRYWGMLGVLGFFGVLFVKMDNDRAYVLILYLLKHATVHRSFTKNSKKKGANIRDIIPFTGIKDGFIEYNGEYYSRVIEIPSVEFVFYSEMKQNNIIERVMGTILRGSGDMMVNLVKLDRPVNFDSCITSEERKVEQLEKSYANGLFSDYEYECRIEVIRDRIEELKHINMNDKVVRGFYYLVLFDKNKDMLDSAASNAISLLKSSDIDAFMLNDTGLCSFCKYNFTYDFDERETEELTAENHMDWILPDKLDIMARKHVCDGVTAHTLRITDYPTFVCNAWGYRLFNIPNTKVVMKFKPLDRFKAVRSIDRAIDELREQGSTTGKTSKILEIQEHVDTLTSLLNMLKSDSETLFEVNLYITVYDRNTETSQMSVKRKVRRLLSEEGFRCDDVLLRQFEAYVSSGVSAYDALHREGRGIHSTSAAAVFPFVHSVIQ
ncbi:MAG: hypothetical protein LBC86_11095, partial [Oscillospiraceae bacterium]|nr:hypothetical protein [Oscillospiraceae bacterium]